MKQREKRLQAILKELQKLHIQYFAIKEMLEDELNYNRSVSK